MYRVVRSFGGNTRGSKVDLSAKDAEGLLSAGYVEKIRSASTKRTPRKRAKKTVAAPEMPPSE